MSRFIRCVLFALLLLWAGHAFAAATVQDRVREHTAARARLRVLFEKANLKENPARAVLVFYKDTRRLDFYAGQRGSMKFVKSYPVLAASGLPGPKLRQGDLQVPEGVYKVTALNPNSLFHLSLRLNYPNAFDIAQAKAEQRTQLGGDIMIHGNSVSTGCIAIGNEGIEELFLFAALSELGQWKVILAPTDFRKSRTTRRDTATGLPHWTKALYEDIESELRALPSYRSLEEAAAQERTELETASAAQRLRLESEAIHRKPEPAG